MKVVVTGAGGCVGRAVVERLLAEPSMELRALFRKPCAISAGFSKRGVEVVYGSIEDAATLLKVTEGANQIVHCAALTKESSGYRKMWEVNVRGTLNLAQQARRSGTAHFVHFSTTAVFGDDAGTYSETSPTRLESLSTRYARTKLLAENGLKELSGREMKITVLRPTTVYGPDSSWALDPLNLISKGIPLLEKENQGFGNFVYVSDVAEAVAKSLATPPSWGGVFHLSGEEIRWKDYYSLYAQLLGRPLRYFPRWIWFLARFLPLLGTYRKILNLSRFYPNDAARFGLGWVPKVDLLEAGDKLAEWLTLPALFHKYRPRFKTALCSQTFQYFSPAWIVVPRSEAQIQRVVQYALQTGKRIRARGATHSFAPLYVTDSVLLDLREFTGVLEWAENSVRVRSGTSLSILMQSLSRKGRCLETHGAIKTQTIAGAISTGTHGCTRRHGSLSSKVLELVFIDGSGQRKVLKRGQPEFDLASISLGTLGVLTEVVLETAPLFYLEESSRAGLLAELLKRTSVNQYFQEEAYGHLLVYPRLGVYRHTRFRTLGSKPSTLTHKSQFVWPYEIALGKCVLPLLASEGPGGKWLRKLCRQIVLRSRNRPLQGEPSGILSTEKPPGSREYPTWDISLAVPEAQADEVLRRTLAFLTPHAGQRKPYHGFIAPMVQLRPQGEESAALSASHGGNRVWFEFWVDSRVGKQDWESFLNDLHLLFEPFHYRVHWGKNTPLRRSHLEKAYPELHAFRKYRELCDPKGLFEAPYLSFLKRAEVGDEEKPKSSLA